jgi:hypothetical protein
MQLKLSPLLKVLGLACGFALFSFIASGQCKGVKEQRDKFTGKVAKIAQLPIGNALAGREVILQQSDGKFDIGLRITFNTEFPDVDFKKGEKVAFKLANGQLIEYTAAKDLKPAIICVFDVPIRNWYVDNEVEAKVYEQLVASPVEAIQFRLNESDHTLSYFKDKQTRKIMETANCILSNQ